MNQLSNRILTDLGIISKIKTGQTLSKRNGKLGVINHDWAEGVQRYRHGETRDDTQKLVSLVVNDAIEYSNMILESAYIHPPKLDEPIYRQLYIERFNALVRFKDALECSNHGIEQLASTYKTDGTFQQELKTIRADANQHVRNLDTKIRVLSGEHTPKKSH